MTALTSAPAGGWTWYNDPRALEYDGVLYFGYVRGSDGSVVVAKWDGSTVSETVIASAFEVDDHDNPSLLVRASDSRLMAFYSKHSTSGAAKYRVTTNVLPDISAWDAAQTLTPVVAGDYTYAMPVQLSGEAGAPIRLFYRRYTGTDYDFELNYNRSDDDGANWLSANRLHASTYTKIATDATHIHFACSDHPRWHGQTSIYHFYWDSAAGTWHDSAGDEITPGGPPMIDTDDMTVVYDGATTRAWIHDIALDAAGDPVIVFATFPDNDGSDHRYQYARWTGTEWSVNEVVAAGGTIAETEIGGVLEDYYSGGVALDQDDPSIVYASVESAGDWEVRRYVTSDGGASWWYSVISSGTGKHVRPVGVRDGSLARALWMTGTYDDYIDYSTGTSGLAFGFLPAPFGAEAGFQADIVFEVGADVTLFPKAFGAEAGFQSGISFRTGGSRQVMLTGGGIETPEMTTGGDEGDVLTQHAGSPPTWEPAAGGGDITTDPAWTAAGDLIVADGDDSAVILAVGDEDDILTVVSGVPAWAPPAAVTLTTADIAALGFVGRIVMVDGITDPPEPLLTEDGTDYIYEDLP
jgi:hypothetical protein